MILLDTSEKGLNPPKINTAPILRGNESSSINSRGIFVSFQVFSEVTVTWGSLLGDHVESVHQACLSYCPSQNLQTGA